MRVEAVVSEQSGEVDDVVHVFVVVRFVRDEDPPWIGAKSLTDAGSVQGNDGTVNLLCSRDRRLFCCPLCEQRSHVQTEKPAVFEPGS